MRIATPLVIAGSFVLSLGLAGCAEEGEPAGTMPHSPGETSAADKPDTSDLDQQAGDVARQAGELAERAGDLADEAADAFVAETRSRVKTLEARVAELRAEAESAEATEAMRKLADKAESSLEALQADLDRLAGASSDQWEEIRAEVADALESLEELVRDDG